MSDPALIVKILPSKQAPMSVLNRALNNSRLTLLLFVVIVTWWGALFLPQMRQDLVWALDGVDATDFEINLGAAQLAWSGNDPYAVETCPGCAFRYSPLFAYVFAPFAAIGSSVWMLLHWGALVAFPLRIAVILPLLWPFWWDVGVGSNMIFILAFAYQATLGRKWAIAATLGLAILAPRPLMLPIVGWLLWQHRGARVPFAVAGFGSIAFAYASGHLGSWVDVLASSRSEMFVSFNVGPSAVIGEWWVLIGIPLAVWLTWRGRLGLASLAASPYWLPYYLLMPVLELDQLQEQREGSSTRRERRQYRTRLRCLLRRH